jgi:hypothetical protein
MAHERALLARLEDPLEDLDVRMAAAHALGVVCGHAATERLTRLASAAETPMLDDAGLQLAVTSIEALGRLHPPDLAQRLQKLRDAGVRPEIRRVVDAATKEANPCR